MTPTPCKDCQPQIIKGMEIRRMRWYFSQSETDKNNNTLMGEEHGETPTVVCGRRKHEIGTASSERTLAGHELGNKTTKQKNALTQKFHFKHTISYKCSSIHTKVRAQKC